MNPKLQFIFRRRSVRKYTDQPVNEETLNDLLEAAMAAPSAVAKDPWNFILVKKRATLNQLAEFMPNAQMLKQAPAAIFVCGDIERAHGQLESYMLQDCSAAIQNILLAASALGLGSCWLGVHPRPERMEAVRKVFNLPEPIIPVSGISLGYPAEQPEPRTRFRPAYVHLETW